jgi:two-component system, LuxR family, response regulator FixJ
MSARAIAIVDDDVAVLESLSLLLRAAGFEVATFESAVRFLTGANPASFACVITDLQMPEMDGFMLQRALAERGAEVPVIIMTGHRDADTAAQARKTGAVEVMVLLKPFDDEYLLGMLRSIVGEAR